jgi:hypothetical protein
MHINAKKEVGRDAFYWALQELCALHRKPFR